MLIHNKDFKIRVVAQVEQEIDALFSIYRLCEDFLSLGPVTTASREMVLADLQHSNEEGSNFCIIESPSGEPIGVVDFKVSGFDGNPEVACLYLLMIASPFRGRGLGERINQAVEAYIRASGSAKAISAGVQVNNPKAIRFWQRMGYQIVSGPIPQNDGTVTFQLYKEL